MKRNSGSPADGDYLGQLKFKGENDADQEVIYAKMTGKISDASDGTEDGLLEFTLKKAGSNNIGARLTSTNLDLLNGTGLTVDGDVDIEGGVDVNGSLETDGLSINGTTVSSTATELNLLDAITRGSLIYGNASGASARLAAGGADKVLTSDGTDISWEDAAGGGAMGFTTNTTIADPPGTVNTDLGNLTDTDTDAFGVTSQPSYDLMEPFGRTVSLDLGAL